MGSKIRWFFIIVGILATLAVCGNIFELKNPDQPRIINPSNPIDLPKVDVKR